RQRDSKQDQRHGNLQKRLRITAGCLWIRSACDYATVPVLQGSSIRAIDLSSSQVSATGTAARRRRLRAAVELHDGDAELAGLVAKVFLNPRPRKNENADGQDVEQRVVALEGRGLAMLRPVRLEGDLRHLAI